MTWSDVLSPAGFNRGDYASVRIVYPEEYAAGISTGEIDSGKAVFLIKDPADDGSGMNRHIFFGGSNSKRQVKHVVRIELEK